MSCTVKDGEYLPQHKRNSKVSNIVSVGPVFWESCFPVVIAMRNLFPIHHGLCTVGQGQLYSSGWFFKIPAPHFICWFSFLCLPLPLLFPTLCCWLTKAATHWGTSLRAVSSPTLIAPSSNSSTVEPLPSFNPFLLLGSCILANFHCLLAQALCLNSSHFSTITVFCVSSWFQYIHEILKASYRVPSWGEGSRSRGDESTQEKGRGETNR